MAELDKKAKAEALIKSLEETYFDLRKSNPERDEHWFLANTWLKRYGSTDEAKQKGAEWARFTAYRDTHQFAILEPPKSIRGLALLLVYKDFGEQQAKHYESELFQIMEPIIQSKKSRVFLDQYQQRNPLTWKEIQLDEEANYSLYWFFRGLEFEQEQDEMSEDEWGNIDIIDKILEEEEKEEAEEEVEEEEG